MCYYAVDGCTSGVKGLKTKMKKKTLFHKEQQMADKKKEFTPTTESEKPL